MNRPALLLVTGVMTALQARSAELPNERFPSLNIQGTVYRNACLDDEKSRLDRSLEKGRAQWDSSPWRLIETLLCAADSRESRSYVARAFPSKVRIRDESTGVESRSRVIPRSPDLVNQVMAKGLAWQASIRIDGAHVILQYYADEACIKGVTIGQVKSRWLIYEIGGACD